MNQPQQQSATTDHLSQSTSSGELRQFTLIDKLCIKLQNKLNILTSEKNHQQPRPSPAENVPESSLTRQEQKHAAGLMRINHTGEICAQGLYYGQSLFAQDAAIKSHLIQASLEEADHLAWCAQRLTQLQSQGSIFNSLWFGFSVALGALAALKGDPWSLGFIAETERQVCRHLDQHLQLLPPQDEKSKRILQQMRIEEAQHATNVLHYGAEALSWQVKMTMRFAASIMKLIVYRW